MTTYISGPMSNMPQFNFPAFYAAAAALRAQGFSVINPAEMDAADPHRLEWHEYLRRDLTELVKCDRIFMLPRWRRSRGARLEHYVAKKLGMQIAGCTSFWKSIFG